MIGGAQDVLQAVRDLDAAFIRSFNDKDAATLTRGFYADNAVLLPPNAPIARGIEAIEAFWRAFIDAGARDAWIETDEVVASGDLAYGVGRYGGLLPTPAGGHVQETGKYLIVLQRQADGGWKTIADQFNSDR